MEYSNLSRKMKEFFSGKKKPKDTTRGIISEPADYAPSLHTYQPIWTPSSEPEGDVRQSDFKGFGGGDGGGAGAGSSWDTGSDSGPSNDSESNFDNDSDSYSTTD
jgi:hypothetical protein